MFVTRNRIAGGLALAVLWTTPAVAHFPHTVMPGETLSSIAAVNGMSTATIAAANGISPYTYVVTGSTILIPPKPAAGTAPAAQTTTTTTTTASAPPPAGAYTVQPGDTLGGIAARAGVTVGQLAYMNGLSPTGVLVSGTALKLPAGTNAGAGSSLGPVAGTTAPNPVPGTVPNATAGRVSASDVQSIAAEHGVPGSLAAAVAWQESGFDNSAVSSANARGVMQVLPGTWTWVEQNLAGRRLDPSSPQENVRAGVLYLGRLLRDSGGDPATAVAGYYQGGESVRRYGMLPETRRYVANVLALRGRFGG